MHTMTMIKEHEGTEEWLCSACGRHLLVRWNPVFEKTVLLEGDPAEKHTGLKNNLLTRDKMYVPVNKNTPPEAMEEPVEDAWLEPWVRWMDEIGFENLWSSDTQ